MKTMKNPAHLLVTPETYAQAHAGPHSRIWTEAERKEFEGLSAVGTFVEEGGNSNEELTSFRPSGFKQGKLMSSVRLCVLKPGW